MSTLKAKLSLVPWWNFPWSAGTAKLLLVLAAALALSLVPGAPKQVQASSLVLQPEESRSDILLQHRIVNQDVSPGSGRYALASVRPYQSDNTVRLEAHATYCDLEGKLLGNCDMRGAHSAFARGELYFDFCIPVRGSSVCGPGDGDPEEIQVTLSFDYDVEGRLIAQPRATAKYGASARVVDPAGNNLYFETLPGQIARGGVTFVKFVPIPTPTFPDATVKERSVFQVTVKRGDMNRFAVSVAARVDTGSLIGGGGDVLLTTGQPLPNSDGHVSIPNVSIDVGVEGGGSDDGPLQELQQQIAELSEQLEDLELRVDSRFGDLNSDLTERLEGLDDVDEGLQSQLDTLLALVTALQGQVDAQAGELTALEDRTTGLEERLTASEEKATDLEEQLSEQEQQISELQGKNTELESQLSDQSQRLSEVEGKAADFEAQLSEQAQQLAELAEEFANHTHDYEAPKGNGNNSKTSETGPPR